MYKYVEYVCVFKKCVNIERVFAWFNFFKNAVFVCSNSYPAVAAETLFAPPS